MPDNTRTHWHSRFDQTRGALLDTPHVLAVRARLRQHAHEPVVLGNATGLERAQRVGMFAGSFNPQTVAHAVVAETARTAPLDMVLWAMARVTVDKEDVARATLADRAIQLLAYCRAATPGDAVIVLDAGLYADQAAAVRTLIAQNAQLWLIVGFDKVVQIFDPRYYPDRDAALRRLFASARLLVVPRAGHGEPELAELLARPENRPFAAGVQYLPVAVTAAAITSTEARRQLAGLAPGLALGSAPGSAPGSDSEAFASFASLLTPEGAALGLATGAYERVARGPDGAVMDRYAARWRRLEALAGSA